MRHSRRSRTQFIYLGGVTDTHLRSSRTRTVKHRVRSFSTSSAHATQMFRIPTVSLDLSVYASQTDVADPDHQQLLKSMHPPVPGAPPSVSCSGTSLTTFFGSNIAFYNLLSACAWFCVKKSVDPFYLWAQNCNQVVPWTKDYPFTAVITTDIPSWASKKLSSGGNFDPSAVASGESSYLPPFHPLPDVRLFRFASH